MTATSRPWDQISADLRRHVVDSSTGTITYVEATPLLREAAVAGDALAAEVAELRESANRWAYKMTLLVGWVKAHCTPEQTAEARMVSQIAENDDLLADYDRLAAVVAAVHTALNQHKADLDAGEHLWAALKFVSAIAKAVGR